MVSTVQASESGELAGRLAGAVWGHLVGDATGVPYEFRPAAQIDQVRFGAAGAHGQPPGTWSDDGALMLALLDSLLTARFDPEHQARRILAWYRDGAYTPDGDGRFDVGNTTREAIHNVESGTPAEHAGPTHERASGNGSLMRILPIALVGRGESDEMLVSHARRASRVTHGTEHAQVACALYVLIVRRLLAGDANPRQTLRESRASLRAVYESQPGDGAALAALRHLELWGERRGRGSAWDSFWSAWDAFAGSSSYEATIERAIRYGNDTDTTAAVAGGLAGAHWGLEGIPTEWLVRMRGRGIVGPLIDRLLAGAGYQTSTLNPIRVDWVPLVTVPGLRHVPGRLGMTFLPGKQRDGWSGLHWRDLETDAERLRGVEGVDTLLLLVQDHELAAVRVPGFTEVLGRHDITVIRHPVPDMDVPGDRPAFRVTLDVILERLRRGHSVVVACRGGLGRTGTAVACLLRDGGIDAGDAIALTRASREYTIERGVQVEFVHGWDWRHDAPSAPERGPS